METETEVPVLSRDLITRAREHGVSGPSVVIGALTAVAFCAPDDVESMRRAAAWTLHRHLSSKAGV